MRALVVGAGGYIGRHLCQVLEARGHPVTRASSQDGSGLDPRGLPAPDFAVAPGTDAVFYLAASPAYRAASEHPDHLLTVNLVSAVALAVCAQRAGARRFIYTSTGNVYAPSFLPCDELAPVRRDEWYVLSRVQAEEALALLRPSLDLVIVRLFGVYGPRQTDRLIPRLITSVRDGRAITLQPHPSDPADHGGLRLSVSYIDDVAEILARVGESGGPPCMNVASDDVASVRSVCETAAALLGKRPVFEVSPTPREFDLLADNALLHRTLAYRFTSMATGLEATIRAM